MQNQEPINQDFSAPEFKEKIETSEALTHPTPDNPPWSSPIAFLFWIISVALIFILPSLFAGVYMIKSGVDFSNPEMLQDFIKNDISVNILSLIAIVPAHILTLIVGWAIVTRYNQFSFRQTLGWRFNKFKVWYIFVITAAILFFAAFLVSIFGQKENELTRILQNSRTAVYIVAFLATFTAPLVEEVVYRGVLYSAFQRTFGVSWAVFLTTLLFALVHVPQYLPDFVSISIICLVSLILTMIRARTGNLLPCIALHFVYNGVQALFLLFEPLLTKQYEKLTEQPSFFYFFIQ